MKNIFNHSFYLLINLIKIFKKFRMNFSSSSSSSSSIGRRNISSSDSTNENDHDYSSSNPSSSPPHPSQLMFNNNQSSNPLHAIPFSSSTPPPPPISSYNPSIYFRNQNLSQQQSLHLLSSPASSIVPPLEVESKPLPQPRIDWNTGLCDCFLDGKNCCITFWCPCVTFGKIAEIVDRGSSSCGTNGALYTLIACVTGFPCFFTCFYRSKLRQQYRLKKSPCCDCLTHFCCSQCALCQEYRELQSRGYNMSVGWHGNLENRSSSTDGDQTLKSVTAAPTVELSMKK